MTGGALIAVQRDQRPQHQHPGADCGKALIDGFRESTQGWRELLLDLNRRGLEAAPKLAVGDGATGLQAGLHDVQGKTRVQRCWVHKKANLLNAMPKSVQPQAKAHLKDI